MDKRRQGLTRVEANILADLSDHDIESILYNFQRIGERIQPILDGKGQNA